MAGQVRNGWTLYQHPLFKARLDALRSRYRALRDELSREELEWVDDVKLYLALVEIINEKVPANPEHEQFRLGTTLGKKHKSWRRVKKLGLPDNRLRLFFMFDSASKVIVYVWLNDRGTLRKDGARTDVYTTFEAMLDKGRPPETMAELLADVAAADMPPASAPTRRR